MVYIPILQIRIVVSSASGRFWVNSCYSFGMKARILLPLLFFLLVLSFTERRAHGASPLWQSVGTGIEYREFYLPEPDHLYVARMDRTDPLVTLESSIAQGRLSGGLETVREQALRYDQAINYWSESWGARNQVVVAINGSFYDPDTGIPWSGMLHSGWYAKRFEDRQNASGFAWTLGRQAFVGGCVMHRAGKQLITFLSDNEMLNFNGINIIRGKNELIIYTPQYDASTLTGDGGVEVLVELNRPMMIMPTPDMITGTVKEIHEGQGSTLIPFDHMVLSASGTAAEGLLKKATIGEKIGISQELRHFESDCRTPSPISWTKAYAGVSSDFTFLANGEIRGNNDLGAILRNPRTAIAFNDRYIFFIVVDGRDRLRSLGMSMVELANFAKNTLGASWGIALDGGGSSTMVVNGEVRNSPNAELVEQEANLDITPEAGLIHPVDLGASSAIQAGAIASSPGVSSLLESRAMQDAAQKIERAVANGMMMVVVQPRQRSTRFLTGDQVIISGSGEVNVRLGPGTNYPVMTTLSPGSQCIVLAHQLNGVLAKGSFWWKIASGDVAGWVSEDLIALQTAP